MNHPLGAGDWMQIVHFHLQFLQICCMLETWNTGVCCRVQWHNFYFLLPSVGLSISSKLSFLILCCFCLQEAKNAYFLQSNHVNACGNILLEQVREKWWWECCEQKGVDREEKAFQTIPQWQPGGKMVLFWFLLLILLKLPLCCQGFSGADCGHPNLFVVRFYVKAVSTIILNKSSRYLHLKVLLLFLPANCKKFLIFNLCLFHFLKANKRCIHNWWIRVSNLQVTLLHGFQGACCSQMRYVAAEIILSGGVHKMEKILWILFIPGNTGFVSQLDYTCLSHPLAIPYGSRERNT